MREIPLQLGNDENQIPHLDFYMTDWKNFCRLASGSAHFNPSFSSTYPHTSEAGAIGCVHTEIGPLASHLPITKYIQTN